MPNLKRSSSLVVRDSILLGKGPAATVRGYDPSGRFVCRLEISNAGIAIYAGEKGQKFLRNVTWERLVEELGKDA
jgi:hypothetical protein